MASIVYSYSFFVFSFLKVFFGYFLFCLFGFFFVFVFCFLFVFLYFLKKVLLNTDTF